MKTLFVYCLLIAVLIPAQGFAHNRENRFFPKCPSCEKPNEPISIEEIPQRELGLEAEDYKALAHSAHESFENEDEKARWHRQFIEKFNFKQIGLNAYRWYGLNRSRPEIANAAANLTLMFLTSHGLETVGGLSLSGYMATGSDLHPVIRSILGAGGVIVTLPGLDPLCIVLYSSYLKWPKQMDRWLEKPRVFLLKGLRFANKTAGLPAGYWSDRFADLKLSRMVTRAQGSLLPTEVTEDGFNIRVQSEDGRELAKLEIAEINEKVMGLKAVEIAPQLSREDQKELSRATSVFGWNVQNFAGQLAKFDLEKDQEKLKDLAWIREIEAIENGYRVTTKPDAFRMPNVCRAFGAAKP